MRCAYNSKYTILQLRIIVATAISIALPVASFSAHAEDITVNSKFKTYTASLNQIADNKEGGFKVYTHNLDELDIPSDLTRENSLIVEDTSTGTFYFVASTDVAGFAKLPPATRQQIASQHGRFVPLRRVGDELRFDRNYNVANALDGDPETSPFPSSSEAGAVLDLAAVAVVPDSNAASVTEQKYGMSIEERSVFDTVSDVSQVVSDVSTAIVVGREGASSIKPVTARAGKPAVKEIPNNLIENPRDFKKGGTKEVVDVQKLLKPGQVALVYSKQPGDKLRGLDGSHVGLVASDVTINGKTAKKPTVSLHYQPGYAPVKIENQKTPADLIVVIDAGAQGANISSARAATCAAGAEKALRDLGVYKPGITTLAPTTLVKAAVNGNLTDASGRPVPVQVYIKGGASANELMRGPRRLEMAVGGVFAGVGTVVVEPIATDIIELFLDCVTEDTPVEAR